MSLSAWAQTKPGTGSLSLQSSQYVSGGQTYFRDDAAKNTSSIAFGLDTERKYRQLSGKVFLKNEYSAAENWNYLKVYELKGSYAPRSGTGLIVGRHLEKWNGWEKEWRQGVYQPRYLQNHLRNEQAGLTGVFASQRAGNFEFTLGALPVHLPEFGAHFYVKDNRFTSENPWFIPPADQFIFRDQVSDIHFSLNKPTPSDVIFNPGAVGKVEWRFKNYFGRLSGAYKPIPQFLLGFPSENRVVVGAEEDYMLLEIHPRIAYHRLVSLDNVVRLGSWTFEVGVTHENPVDTDYHESLTGQQVEPAWITALSVSRPLEIEGLYAARVKLGFLKVNGGDARDRGEFARDVSLFEPRYQYLEAYRLALNKPWRGIFKFPLQTELAAIFDREQNGGVVSFTSSLNLSREFSVSLEADFLGLVGTKPEREAHFLSTYRANDRVGLGMNYVF